MKRFGIVLLVALLGACGGGGSDKPTPPPVAVDPPSPVISLQVIDEDKASVGTVLGIGVVGAGPGQVTRAYLDAADVPFELMEGRIYLPTAALAAGQHTISVEIGGRQVTRAVMLRQTILPAEPKAYLGTVVQSIQASLAARVPAASEPDRVLLQSLQSELARQALAIPSLDDKTAREIALLVAANGLAPTSLAVDGQSRTFGLSVFMASGETGVYAFDEAACTTASRELVAYVIGAAASIRAATIAPHVLAKLVALGSAFGFVALVSDTTGTVLQKCVVESDILNILDASSRAAIAGVQQFNHGMARDYALQVRGRLSSLVGDATIAQVRGLGDAIAQARTIAARLAIEIPAEFGAAILAFGREHLLPGRAERYEIVPSDSRIESLSGGSGEVASIRFRFREGQMPSNPVDFSFAVQRRSDGVRVASHAGRLDPAPLPVAFGQTVWASPGIALNGQLRAEGATSFEIVKAPRLGTVIMTDASKGSFTYVVNTATEALDNFTFRAINSAGKSAETPVAINIDMRVAFERAVLGNWSVSNLEGGTTYQLTVEEGGTGYYDTQGTRYRVRWEVRRNQKGEYAFYEYGFWHPAYDGQERDGLALPVTNFYTYMFDYSTMKTDYTKRSLYYAKQ